MYPKIRLLYFDAIEIALRGFVVERGTVSGIVGFGLYYHTFSPISS